MTILCLFALAAAATTGGRATAYPITEERTPAPIENFRELYVDAASFPLARWGAPSAVLTVT